MTLARRSVHVLGAVTIAVSLGLSGCSQGQHPPASPTVETSPPPSAGMPAPARPAPGGPPLPPSTELTDVMVRLTDPAVPGAQKITLIESGSPEEAVGLDKFVTALRDNGSLPLTFEARDLAWSPSGPGNLTATVVVRTANPQGGEFTYPMEFVPAAGSWQLARRTADELLQLEAAATTPAPGPPPAPPR